MSFTDDTLPLDELLTDEEPSADDELETSDADEEMSGELDSEIADEALDEAGEADEAKTADADEDDEKEVLRQRVAEYEAQLRRADYEKQQEANQAHWDRLEAQADAAFDWEEEQIWAQKDNYVDPDAYVRAETRKLKARRQDWHKRFMASKQELTRQQYERAAVPTYAARVATHYDLSEEQATELLDYHPQDMVREAKKMDRVNKREAQLRKQLQQTKRKQAQDQVATKGITSGTGGRTVRKIQRGSMDHLKALFANANAQS